MQDWPLFTTALTLPFFHRFLIGMAIAGVAVFFGLCFINAGYGQYIDKRWGRAISNRAGWLIMELPVVVLFFLYWITSERALSPTPLVFFFLFNLHYCQRTFVFPLLIRGRDLMPLSIILFGMTFNTANAYMQGAWIFHLSPENLYTPEWLATPQFLVGAAIGWAILTLSWPGMIFAFWTFANLAPRARRNHDWYLDEFGDEYPRGRKRLIPFVY
jgi:3-oxo-5-alpha-steroid 4-dehydrogenase 1